MYQMIGIDPALEGNVIPQFTPGTRGTDNDGKIYKYLRYNEGTAAVAGVAGEVAAYFGAGGSQDHDVSSDYSDGVSIGAGVLQVGLTDLEYGWFQIKGPATLSIAATAGADGNAMTCTGAGDGTLDVSALVTDHICAIADDISADEYLLDFPW